MASRYQGSSFEVLLEELDGHVSLRTVGCLSALGHKRDPDGASTLYSLEDKAGLAWATEKSWTMIAMVGATPNWLQQAVQPVGNLDRM